MSWTWQWSSELSNSSIVVLNIFFMFEIDSSQFIIHSWNEKKKFFEEMSEAI